MTPMSGGLHLGLVTAKYGVAGYLAVVLAHWLVPKDVLSVAFVSLMCVQPSLVSGIKAGREQILASGLGVLSTLLFLLFFPINPWTIGASVAMTYAVTTYMRWGYPALVVALFSSLYMTLLVQATAVDTLVLRFQAVILGVAVGFIVNLLFSPIARQVNLIVRIQGSMGVVRAQLVALRAALVSRDAKALEAGLGSFQAAFRHLGAVKDDLAGIRRELKLPGYAGRRSFAEVYFSDRCIRELELITHHAQDVAMASLKLVSDETAVTGPLSEAHDGVLRAIDILDMSCTGRHDRAEALSEEARADALQGVGKTAPAAMGFSPRLVLAFALIQLHAHLAELAQSAKWLDEAHRDPERALEMAAFVTPGGPHEAQG